MRIYKTPVTQAFTASIRKATLFDKACLGMTAFLAKKVER